MKGLTRKKAFLFIGVLLAWSLAGCVAETEAPSAEETKECSDNSVIYTLSDADLNNGAENPEEIVFGEDGICLIEESGEYTLTGKQTGQIRIDVQDEMVHLILDNAELHSLHGPAVYVKSAAKVVITVPEGSSSVVEDTAYYDGYTEEEACIYSEDDLTFNGSGTLRVNGYGKDAVRTKDTLKILDTELLVQSKGMGLRGNDGVVIKDAVLDVQCEGNGIYTKKKDKENKGFIDITGGTVNIIAGKYGMDAAGDVHIRESSVSLFGVVQNIACSGTQYIQEGCLE